MRPRAAPRLRWLWAALALFCAVAWAAEAPVPAARIAAGARIYLAGELPSGGALAGVYGSGTPVSGAAAACVACHRGSGLGGVEGSVGVPPISGRALFGGGDPVIVRMDRLLAPGLSMPRVPLSAADFARVVREGRGPDGRELNALMPRYALDDEALADVAAYLGTLSVAPSPGTSAEEIHVATVMVPGVAPARRKAVIDTIQLLVRQTNLNVRSGFRQKMPLIERQLASRRRLVVEVWDLTGAPASWARQLDEHQRTTPVFAILSGLGGADWRPVQEFCERARVGCWFPSLDVLPDGAEEARYSLYFSAGIGLEARAVATRLAGASGHVLQVVSADATAVAGAASLVRAGVAPARGVETVSWSGSGAKACHALEALAAGDVAVLWLRPAELARLGTCAGTRAAVFVSGTLAGEEPPRVPAGLRRDATLVDPREVPGLRAANLERFDAWRAAVGIPLIDRRAQSEAYFATRFLLATTRSMLNNLHTDYLIERGQAMLAPFEISQVQEEIEAKMMAPMNRRPLSQVTVGAAEHARAAELQARLDEMRARGGTTVYPRLSLAAGQSVASKGAYLYRLDPAGSGPAGQPEWVVP